jgi:hypothetical protein
MSESPEDVESCNKQNRMFALVDELIYSVEYILYMTRMYLVYLHLAPSTFV